jgi:hypothetical protein
MNKYELLENIHNNLVNGNRRDCVKSIDEYGLYDFWREYKDYLTDLYMGTDEAYGYYTDMTISYFRIKSR